MSFLRNRLPVVLFLAALHFSTTPAQTSCTPMSVPYPQMGINIPDAVDLPWVNLWHQINPWHSTYNNGIEFGTDGWTTAGREHRFIAGADKPLTNYLCPAGVYKVSWKGNINQILYGGHPVTNGDESWGGVVQNLRANYPSAGYHYYELNYPRPPESIEFRINGHIEDVKIVRPGFELNDTRVIHPKYTDLLKPYTTIRFMPFLSTNAHMVNSEYECQGPSSVSWAERANPNTPAAVSAVQRKGGAWEFIVSICNELNKDAWINVPIVANDDYVRGLAKLFKENMKPSLKVNIELGNETWNTAGGFCCFRQIVNYHCGDDWGCHQRYPAKRLKQIVDLFAVPYGWSEINNRVRAILCGQIGYAADGHGWTIAAGLSYLEDSIGPGTARKYLYAVGAAPYFGPEGDNSSVTSMIDHSRHNIDSVIFGEYSDEYHTDSRQWMGNKLEGWLGQAGQYGLKLYCYEGGPDMDYTTGSGGIKDLAMRDPRMKDLCVNYWTKWYARYGYDAIFCFFLGAFNSGGLYTLGENMDTLSTRQAAMNQIMTSPAPSFDTTIRQVIPGPFEIRKVSAYWSGWDRDSLLNYRRGEVAQPNWHPGDKWSFAAAKNGTYRLAVRYSTGRAADIDIYVDGILKYPRSSWPTAASTGAWTDANGVILEFDLSYGVHVLRFEYRGMTDMALHQMRWTLTSETPPFAPQEVSGDISACLGNPAARYTVEIDQSVCTYEWDAAAITAAGGRLLPPSGGGGSVRTGQGTNTIYVDWSGVPEGSYNLRVRGSNDVGVSPWRTFTVTVGVCGFTMSPNPTCVGDTVTVTPRTPAGVTQWTWNFGPNATPYTLVRTDANPIKVVYAAPGDKAVSLTIRKADASTQAFINSIVVGSPVGGTATPTPASINRGSSSTITIAGYNGRIVRWQTSTNGGTSWSDLSTVDLPLSTGPLADTTRYRAVIVDGGCDEVYSSAAMVMVTNPAQPGAVQKDTTIAAGTSPGTLTLTGHGGTIVRWEQSTTAGTWTAVTNTAATYAPGTLTQTTAYRAIVRIDNVDYPSGQATVTVTPARPGRVERDTTIVSGATPGTLRLVDYDGTILRWERQILPSGAWTPISNTSATYAPGVLTQSTAYRAVVRIGTVERTSTAATVTVNEARAGYVDGDTTIAAGSNPGTLTLRDYSGTIVRWEYQLAPDTVWRAITNTAATYAPGVLTRTTRYRAVVQISGVSFNSVHATVTVNAVVLAQPVPVPDGGSYPQRVLTVRFAPSAQDSVRDIYFVVCAQQVPCPLTNAQLYRDSLVLDLAAGPKALRFEARPKPGREATYATSAVDSALYVYSPRVLGAPVPRPGSGTSLVDTVRVRFESTDQSRYRAIYYRVCADTVSCALDASTRLLYDSTAGILLDLSSGQRGLVFQAVPLPAYVSEYEQSVVRHALYQYRPEFAVSSAAYFDRNGDGRIDAARVVFNKPIATPPAQFSLSPPSGGTAVAVAPSRQSPTTFDADFQATPFGAVETGFAPGPYGRVVDATGLFASTAFTVADSVAPVVVSARYGMANEAVSGMYTDTLVVVFSEAVSVGGAQPFAYSGSISTLALTQVRVSGSTLTAVVQWPEGSRVGTPSTGDSLWISTMAGIDVADTRGVVQRNSMNRKVPIVVTTPPDFFRSVSGPVPFDPQKKQFVMVLRPNARVSTLLAGDRASVTVRDGLGNVVASGQFVRGEGELRWTWDGRNRDGRLVGQGTYVAQVSLTIGGRSSSMKTKIGVDRE